PASGVSGGALPHFSETPRLKVETGALRGAGPHEKKVFAVMRGPLQPSASCFGLPGRGVLSPASVRGRLGYAHQAKQRLPCTAWFCPR
ncbi:MAG: hypothetical protein LBT00_01695, partial [Spirochaetaceae bacterium]|nr:hypothetical protein [Spirochaetaceae bacterium]